MVKTNTQGADLNFRSDQRSKKFPFIAMNNRGHYLHMTGTCPTADREHAWQGTREQFLNLQAAQPEAKQYSLYREVDQ